MLIDKALRKRLMKLAHKYGAEEPEDAVQETLLAVFSRGEKWHEGRIVLELRNQIRHIRRKAKVRAHIAIDMGDAATEMPGEDCLV